MQVQPEEECGMKEDYLALVKERSCPVCHNQLHNPEDEEVIGGALKGIHTEQFGWNPGEIYKLFCGHDVRIQRSAASENGERQIG